MPSAPVASVALALVVLLAGCTGAAPAPAGGTGAGTDAGDLRVTVARVVDGDTVEVAYANGTADTVRLVGVDTPEVHSENTPGEFEGVPDTAAGRDCLRRWGERASSFATERLEGREVTLRFDPNLDRRGYYNRLLAYVVVGGDTFNARLVDRGYARVYDSDFSDRGAYADSEAAARERDRGLWACATDTAATPTGAATPTPTVAAGGTALAVAEVHADAAGNDNDNPNDEYVVFANRGDDPIDLSGWTVRDEAGHEYAFPDGFTLGAGERVTLHTGSGTDTDADLYWGRSGAVWNNGGDTVTVRDAGGTVVAERSY